jgi:hypothetical protein
MDATFALFNVHCKKMILSDFFINFVFFTAGAIP